MSLDIAFWVLAIGTVLAAIGVVAIKNLFRAALCLVACFFLIAGVFATLNADFLAGVQVLVYVGAIAVVILFAILLTRDTQKGNPSSALQYPVIILTFVLLGFMIFAVVGTDWPAVTVDPGQLVAVDQPTTSRIAEMLFAEDGYVLPLEISAVLLLAALTGAMVMARGRKD